MATAHEITETNSSNINTTESVKTAEKLVENKKEVYVDGTIYTTSQLNGASDEKRSFLTDEDTMIAIKDAKYDVSMLVALELPKIKALVSYSSIKAINNKIYKAAQLLNCEVDKIKLLTSESITKIVTTKVYTPEQLLSCDVETIQILTSAPVLNAIEHRHYTAKQLLACDIEKIQILTSDNVIATLKDKVFTAEQLLGCDPEKIKALTSEQAIETIRPEKSKVDTVKDIANEYAAKIKAWKEGTTVTKNDNEFKDIGLYTAKELLAYETHKILALTDEISQALIVNHIFTIQQMLAFDVTHLEAFIAKARSYEDPENIVTDLGKVYFFALNGEHLPLRNLLEKDKESANNNDNLESPLAVTVHAGYGPNAHLLVQHNGHFNHHDFVMDPVYAAELLQYIPNILSKQEQKTAFSGFAKYSEASNCLKQFEDYCLVEHEVANASTHDEL